jgi:type IV secretory pathway VirB6-like protein
MIRDNKFYKAKQNIFFLFKIIVICCLLIISNNKISHGTEAKFDGVGRVRNCEKASDNQILVEPINGIGFDGGKDAEFVFTNEVCRAIAITIYVDVKASIAAMNLVCRSGSYVPRVFPSIAQDVRDMAKAAKSAVGNTACTVGLGNAMRSFTTALVSFGVVNSIAKAKFSSVKICGSGWKKPNPAEYLINSPGIEQEIDIYITNQLASGNVNLSMSDVKYRQFVYGGEEIEDNTDQGEICYDATQDKLSNGSYPKQKYYLRGSQLGNFNCQKYLVSTGQDKNGLKLTTERLADIKKSYDCCVKRSKNFICLKDDSKVVFCKAGSTCNINGVYYKIWFENNQRMICGQSYSLCPYNFNIEGGSDYCDNYCDGIYEENSCHPPKNAGGTRYLNAQEWDKLIKEGKCGKTAGVFNANGEPISEVRNSNCTLNEKVNKCRNYCQYMRHCTVASDTKFKPINNITSPYFSQACINFVGDSKNVAAYDGGILGSYTNFSAPIAQCFKETMENLFFNRVGHSRCSDSAELPNKIGECISNGGGGNTSYLSGNGFIYKAGSKVQNNSIFVNIQEKMKVAIKIFLSLAVIFFGANILMQKVNLGDKKTLMLFLLKFALVGYFALGDAWQGYFFSAVYDLGGDLGNILYNVKTPFSSITPEKLDGCQFGIIRSKSGEVIDNSNSGGINKQIYPTGKKYLAMWDTMDCKIAKYLGMSLKPSAANIVLLIIASFFTGPIGIYFACSVLIFGLLVLFLTIRALHIFICSCFSVVIFVFISPLIIPTILFEKTKNIFDSWFKELIGFGLQVAILFAYIGIVVSVMDTVLVGKATFIGDNPRSLNCNQYCIKADGTASNDITNCKAANDIPVNPLDSSVLCLINIDSKSFNSYPGFEIIGVSIIALKNLFDDPSKTSMRLLTIFKGVLVLFLLYKFMDEIPGISEQLSGGTQLPSSKADALKAFMRISSLTQGFVKRARRGSIKLGKAIYKRNQDKKDEE